MTITDPQPPHDQSNPDPKPRARKGLIVFAVATVLLCLVAFAISLSLNKDKESAASYSSAYGGHFSMQDQNGKTVTDQTLRGKPYAIFFGFTRCPDVCPTTLSVLTQLRKQLGSDGDKFNIVFVSVDPEHDKPEDIGRYLDLFGTPIIGLTGSDEQIAQIVKAFHVFYEKVPVDGGGYTIDHTASVILMDAKGRFISTIAHQENPEIALQKLERLIKS